MKKKRLISMVIMLLAILLLAMPVQAASKKYTNKWIKKNQKVYYYNAKGRRATGLVKIRSKQYYFDKKGVQHVGWQKIGSRYYYFKIARGSNAYMVKSSTVNGITLDARGRAATDSTSLRKLKIMVAANQTVESITTPLMSKKEKLQICFNYTKTKFGYTTPRTFSATSGWEMDYAEDMFFRGRGNCFSYAAAFAFLANAVGYNKVYVISSGGHGWAEIGGKVYDPDWALASSVDSYFAMSYSLSGVQGRPNYAPNRTYVVKL